MLIYKNLMFIFSNKNLLQTKFVLILHFVKKLKFICQKILKNFNNTFW